MPQPRKEQVLDLKSKYTRIDFADAPNNTLPLGNTGPVQVIQNTGAYPDNFYTQLLDQTVTGVVGGAETSAPAIMYGGFGPFAIASGQAFTITMLGVNSGNPVNITFQASDIVNINGIPKLTTSRAAARINSALSSAGVNVSTPVASNKNGQLVLTSAGPSGYTYGSTAFITASDVTAGTIATLGFGTILATTTGVTAPQRGIVTTSQDGMGGYVQVRSINQTAAISQSNVALNLFSNQSYPSIPAGQPLFARLQAFPGASPPGTDNLTISYFRQGQVPGRLITSSSNFATILTSDTFSITYALFVPAIKTVFPGVLDVTFATAPAQPSDVVNAVLAALTATGAGGFGPTTGLVVAQNPGPYRFLSGTDQFFIALNGNTPIKISLSNENTPADVAATINAAIATAGQSAQGSALASSGPGIGAFTLVITSSQTTGFTSSVQIFPGSDPLTPTVPGHFYTTLDKLGLVPGITTGYNLCQLYGNDEIVFTCPQSEPGTFIQVSASSAMMAKLGFPGTTVSSYSGPGFDPVPAPQLQTLIPEVMEFGEVPDNVDVIAEGFGILGIPNPTSPAIGTGNLGLSPLFEVLDGKINPDLIRKSFDTLNVQQLTLGALNLSNDAQASIPRMLTPFTNVRNWTLLWEADVIQTGTTVGRQRLYIDHLGQLWLTTNAYATAGGATWNREVTGNAASAIVLGQVTGVPKIQGLYSPSSAGTPFNWNVAPVPVVLDSGGADNASTAFMHLGTQNSADDQVPRILTNTDPTSAAITLLHLIPGNVGLNYPAMRIYSAQAANNGTLIWTVNASWNGSAWSKDVNGVQATQLTLTNSVFVYSLQQAGDNTPWTSWDLPVMQVNPGGNTVSVGELIAGFNQPSTPAGRGQPRLQANHNSTTAGQRTLIAAWQGGLGLNFYRYRCCETSGTFPFDDCIMDSVNAYWVESSSIWQKEQSYNNSMLTITSGSDVSVYFKGGNVPFSWPDTTWNQTYQWSIGSATIFTGLTVSGGDGIYVTSTTNSSNQDAQANILKPTNIPKAWGMVVMTGGSLGVIDSYNVSSVSYISSTEVAVNLYAGIPIGSAPQSPMCIIISGGFFSITVMEPSNVIGSAVGNNSSGQFFFEGWEATSATALDLETANVWFTFVLFGRQ